MMNYIREGGFSMWLMILTTVATAALAFARRREQRPDVLLGGLLFVVLQGVLGLSTGMIAVSRSYSRFPDKTDAIAQGLGELANNGTLCFMLGTALGVATLVTRRMARNPA